MDIEDILPPDDSGRDAFERYRYQAHAAFPHCLNCATGNGVVVVTCEHIEDVCVEESNRLRLCQIKTRNPDYGLWTLSDLCARSGALRSLLRSHRALVDIGDDRQIVYEIWLEGATKRGDLIQRLEAEGGGDDEIARAVAKQMRPHTEVKLKEAREFIGCAVVHKYPSRDDIVARNLLMLGGLAPSLNTDELREIYERVIELICQAMSGTQIADWPATMFAAEHRDDDKAAIDAKQLTRDKLRTRLGPALADGGAPMLQDVTDPEALRASTMEYKLRAAGAPDALVARAKSLRANATRREIELLSQNLRTDLDVKFEDLNTRLLTAAVAGIGAKGAGGAGPVFADILDRLAASPATYDPTRLFQQDPLLLMGGVCDLSDRCMHAWSDHA